MIFFYFYILSYKYLNKMKIKTTFLLLALFIVTLFPSYAQEELQIKNSDGDILMEVREDGVLLPKLTTADRTANAATLGTTDNGLLVYDTDTESFWLWNGNEWEAVGSNPTDELQLLSVNGDVVTLSNGNAITLPGLQYLYKNKPLQERLDDGESTCDLIRSGVSELALFGLNYEGGVILDLEFDRFTGCKILIAALEDVNIMAEWGCMGTQTSALQSGFYTGDQNTTTILNICQEAGIAAEVASNYTGGGFTDWYLPTIEELFLALSLAPGVQPDVLYWSSNEEFVFFGDANNAIGVQLSNGTAEYLFQVPKNTPGRVRPVRFVVE